MSLREALVMRTAEGPDGTQLDRVSREMVSPYGLQWAMECMWTGERIAGERFTAICVVDAI